MVPRVIRVPKAVLILEIERSILEIERSTLPIERSFPIVTDPSLSTDPPPMPGHKIDLGHNPRAEMSNAIDKGHNPRAETANGTDPRVGTDNNVEIHVTQKVPITLATHVTDLVPTRLADGMQTEITPGAEINTAKTPARAPHSASKVIAHFGARTTKIPENAPLLIKISALNFVATSALPQFITEHLPTVFFRASRPLNRALFNSRK